MLRFLLPVSVLHQWRLWEQTDRRVWGPWVSTLGGPRDLWVVASVTGLAGEQRAPGFVMQGGLVPKEKSGWGWAGPGQGKEVGVGPGPGRREAARVGACLSQAAAELRTAEGCTPSPQNQDEVMCCDTFNTNPTAVKKPSPGGSKSGSTWPKPLQAADPRPRGPPRSAAGLPWALAVSRATAQHTPASPSAPISHPLKGRGEPFRRGAR